MDLISVELDGYRRFETRSTMDVGGRLVAIVGPNEAGKSSFLKSLEHLNGAEPFVGYGPGRELNRRREFNDNDTIIEAAFLLDANDLSSIQQIEGTRSCRWFRVYKLVDGRRTYRVTPTPKRSMKRRAAVTKKLEKYLPKIEMEFNGTSNYEYDFPSNVNRLLEFLGTEEDGLGKPALATLDEVISNLHSSGIIPKIDGLEEFAVGLKDLAEDEARTPHLRAIDVLSSRIPEFRMFGDAERDLKTEYNIEGLQSTIPFALRNLLELAELDIHALIRLSQQGDIGGTRGVISKCNDNLKKAFESWTQSKVSVRLELDATTLNILIDEGDHSFVSIAERSDGLRQYVALLAFVRLKADAPSGQILLIDEIETHLHYDAQADVIQMLARQELVPKVIYTTHSIGCLPEDLGTGVRIIERDSEVSSRMQSWFWLSKEKGFNPLLYGMGAKTLAFISIRYAVFVEGPTDMILLPTLLREAFGEHYLGFQIVPGLSEADRPALIQFNGTAPRTAFLTDSDEGGTTIVNDLKDCGIPEASIFSLPKIDGQGAMSEDFVDPQVYVRSVNRVLDSLDANSEKIALTNLTHVNRPKAVEDWCLLKGISPPSKRSVAYHIVEDRESSSRVDKSLRAPLKRLLTEIRNSLEANSTAGD